MIDKTFILAGRAVFTISNGKGEWYTFRIKRKMYHLNDIYFVSLLVSPNEYAYIGVLREYTGKVQLTAKSHFSIDSKPYQVLQWAIALIWSNSTPPKGYTLDHNGYCGRCGRVLTTPESLKRGLGPECWRELCG